MICYMHNSASRLRIVLTAKMFWIYFRHFRILPRVRNWRILVGLWEYVSMSRSIVFLDRDNEMRLALAFYSCILKYLRKKKQILLYKVWSLYQCSYKKSLQLKIIATIIATNFYLLRFYCPFIELNTRMTFLASSWSPNKRYFCFFFTAISAL